MITSCILILTSLLFPRGSKQGDGFRYNKCDLYFRREPQKYLDYKYEPQNYAIASGGNLMSLIGGEVFETFANPATAARVRSTDWRLADVAYD